MRYKLLGVLVALCVTVLVITNLTPDAITDSRFHLCYRVSIARNEDDFITLYLRGSSRQVVEAVSDLRNTGLSARVKTVYFRDTILNADIAHALRQLQSLKRISANGSHVDITIARDLGKMDTLEYLDIPASTLSCDAWRTLLNNQNLKWLDVTEAQISHDCRFESFETSKNLIVTGLDRIDWTE
jgi:hypothetical protein